ncbi:hypothetical protein XP420_15725 [Xanthomonas perforans]|nr:hypothetical protein XP420_15725 [Xanthomonas perforans]
MGFILFKVRIVYGWLLGLYDKERRNERLAIVTKYAKEPTPHDLGWTPSRLIILRHDKFMWIVETVLLFTVLILTIPVADYFGLISNGGLLALVFLLVAVILIYCCIRLHPNLRTIYRRELLDEAMFEVATMTLHSSDDHRKH